MAAHVKVEGFASNRLCLLAEITHWCGPQYVAQEMPGAQEKPAEKWAGALRAPVLKEELKLLLPAPKTALRSPATKPET